VLFRSQSAAVLRGEPPPPVLGESGHGDPHLHPPGLDPGPGDLSTQPAPDYHRVVLTEPRPVRPGERADGRIPLWHGRRVQQDLAHPRWRGGDSTVTGLFVHGQRAPPSMCTVVALRNVAAGPARNATVAATSSTWPTPPSDRSATRRRIAGGNPTPRPASSSPGETTTVRMLY